MPRLNRARTNEFQSPDLADDVSGAVIPGLPGQGIDRWQVALSVSEWNAAKQDLAIVAENQSRRRLIEAIRLDVDRLEPWQGASTFGHWLASANGSRRSASSDRVGYALSWIQLISGSPAVTSIAAIIPEDAFVTNWLFFPWGNFSLSGATGAILMETNPTSIQITWTDGERATIPLCDDPQLPAHHPLAGRLRFAARTSGFAIDNGMGEFDRAEGLQPSMLRTFAEAVSLLGAVWPEALGACRRFVSGVIFLHSPRTHSVSHTLGTHQGLLFTSVHTPLQVADALCHEASHIRLNVVLRQRPLLVGDDAEIYASPWRSDPRPLMGLLNGVHAFVNVALFHRRVAEQIPSLRASAGPIYESQRNKVQQAWVTLRSHARPTALGEAVMTELESQVAAL
jgi:HEXXH motif-containing protein